MSNLCWLDVTNISFDALLLLEPLHIDYIASQKPDEAMGTALKAHPAVQWYMEQTHPPARAYIDRCLTLMKGKSSPKELRQAEAAVLNRMQDWFIYALDPAKYDQLAFLNWDDVSLLSMADFSDKIILDVDSGTGRLTFTVAPQARVAYAVDLVANLRRYLWKKKEKLHLSNVYPLDGSTTRIPLALDFSDILMAGHVFGDAPEREYEEFKRVVRSGGMILLHLGSNAASEDDIHHFLVHEGFLWDTFEEPGDSMKRKYKKAIHK